MTATEMHAPPPTTHGPVSGQSWIVLGLMAAILIVSAGAVGWWLGSRDSRSAETPEIVERWAVAWPSGDADAVATLYTEDGVYADTTDNNVVQTRSGIQSYLARSLTYVAFAEMEPQSVVVGDDAAVVE